MSTMHQIEKLSTLGVWTEKSLINTQGYEMHAEGVPGDQRIKDIISFFRLATPGCKYNTLDLDVKLQELCKVKPYFDGDFLEKFSDFMIYMSKAVAGGVFVTCGLNDSLIHIANAQLVCLKYMGHISKILDDQLENMSKNQSINKFFIPKILDSYKNLNIIPPKNIMSTYTRVLCNSFRNNYQRASVANLDRAFIAMMCAYGRFGIVPEKRFINYLDSISKTPERYITLDTRSLCLLLNETARIDCHIRANCAGGTRVSLAPIYQRLVKNTIVNNKLLELFAEPISHSYNMYLDADAYFDDFHRLSLGIEEEEAKSRESKSSVERSFGKILKSIEIKTLDPLKVRFSGRSVDFQVQIPYMGRVLLELDGIAHLVFNPYGERVSTHLSGGTVFQSHLTCLELAKLFEKKASLQDTQEPPRILVRIPTSAVLNSKAKLDPEKVINTLSAVIEHMAAKDSNADIEAVTINNRQQVIPLCGRIGTYNIL